MLRSGGIVAARDDVERRNGPAGDVVSGFVDYALAKRPQIKKSAAKAEMLFGVEVAAAKHSGLEFGKSQSPRDVSFGYVSGANPF